MTMTNDDRRKVLYNAIDKIKERESQDITLDFDEAIKEHETKNKPIQIKLKGKIYELPSSMPFTFLLYFSRHCVKKKKGKEMIEVPNDKVWEFIEKMFGAEFTKAIEKHNIGLETVMDTFVPRVLEAWGYKASEEDEKKIAV